MPLASKVRVRDLVKRLDSLDIDEGIRIECGIDRIFINRRPSETFVVQFDNTNDFRYLDSAKDVAKLAKMTFGGNYDVWAY